MSDEKKDDFRILVENQGREVMRFENNGDIYVNGRLADNDKEVVEGMRSFLRDANHIKGETK